MIGAIVAAVGAVASAVISSNGANDAAQTQANSVQSANALQAQEFNITQANEAPYIQAGDAALKTLQAGALPGGQFNKQFTMQDFMTSPEYNFQQQQGAQTINAAAAAGGTTGSPATTEALMQFNQGLASTSYQQNYDNFMGQQQAALQQEQQIALMGQAAVAGQAASGANYATQAGNNLIGAGNAQAAAQAASAKSYSGLATSLTGPAMQNYAQQTFGQNGAAASGPIGPD